MAKEKSSSLKPYSGGLLLMTFCCHLAIVFTPVITICGVVSELREMVPLVEPVVFTYLAYWFFRREENEVEKSIKLIRNINIALLILLIVVWTIDFSTAKNPCH